jgi:hypothetical protein
VEIQNGNKRQEIRDKKKEIRKKKKVKRAKSLDLTPGGLSQK